MSAVPAPPVVACLRAADLHPGVDPLTGAVRREPSGLGLSGPDAAALEHALRAAERWATTVTAVAAGPAAVEPVLRDAAAHGIAVLRVETGGGTEEDELAGDEHRWASAVAAALLETVGVPRLTVCGDRSPDRGTGAFPAFLAHELGAAQALGLVALAVDGDGTLRAERRLDGGRRERLRVPPPAVCSVEAAGTRLRRAPLTGAVAAGELTVPVARPAPPRPAPAAVHVARTRPFAPRARPVRAPAGVDPRQRILDLCGALEQREPPVVLGPLAPAEAAGELLGFLVRHGYRADPTELGATGGPGSGA